MSGSALPRAGVQREPVEASVEDEGFRRPTEGRSRVHFLAVSELDVEGLGGHAPIAYDVIQGDLVDLRGFAGDFSISTDTCLINDTPATTWPQPVDPAPGEMPWFVVRAILAGGPLSYDTFFPSEVASRDAGVVASGNDCP